jgi:DNA/RNA endonuclease YhcR with UshA esterase domain
MRLHRTRAVALTAIVVLTTALIPVRANAHHARSGYDLSRTITLKGTITRVEWTNPHALLYFDVTDGNGHVQNWHAITGGPSRMSRYGWNGDTLKPGDTITITGNPTKDGTSEIWLDRITLPGGREVVMHR